MNAFLLVAALHLIPGSFVPGSQPDGNTVVIDAPAGLIVVDTGRHAEHTQRIIDYAKSSGKPVAAILNTHWHLDHVGGNARLKEQFPAARVYASNAIDDALRGFLANYRKQLADMHDDKYRDEIALIDAGPKLRPDEVVTSSGTRTIAGRKLVINLDHDAVTAADIWIVEPETRTVIAGDLVTLPAPFLDTACPAGWSRELSRIDRTDFDLLIPGHGDPMSHRGFSRYRAAFDALIACKDAKDPCIEKWLEATRALAPRTDEKFAHSLMSYYVDLLRSGRLNCDNIARRDG